MSGLFDDASGDDLEALGLAPEVPPMPQIPGVSATAIATQAASKAYQTAMATPPSAQPVRINSIALLEKQLDRKVTESKVPPLGAIVWWTFTGIETTVQDLKNQVKAFGLDEKLVPVPEAKGALSDGIKSLGLKGLSVTRSKVDNDRFMVTLETDEVQDNGGRVPDLAHKVEQSVVYNYADKSLTFKTPFFEHEIRAAYNKFLTTLQSSDLRTVVMRALTASHAITCRQQGGVYFVPRQALDVVDKLRGLCGSIPGAGFNRLRIADEPEERADMLKSAGAEIEAELVEVEKEVAELLAKAAQGEKVRPDTANRRIERFAEIKNKALAYKDLLEFKAEGVDERLKKLDAQVRPLT